MKKFVRQKPANTATVNVEIDFGAASAQIAKVFDPEVYKLRIEAARVVEKYQNISIALDIIEAESSSRVAIQPMWVHGPNANAGGLAAENQHKIGQLLKLAGEPTAGEVHGLIPKLAGLTFDARLVLDRDDSTGRTFNVLDTILTDGVS